MIVDVECERRTAPRFGSMVSDFWKGFSTMSGVVLVLYAIKLLMGG